MRLKVTTFTKQQDSKQEFAALIGKVIDKAHVEPLHLKNNALGIVFKVVLKEAVAKSNISPSCKSYSNIPKNSRLFQIVNALKTCLNIFG